MSVNTQREDYRPREDSVLIDNDNPNYNTIASSGSLSVSREWDPESGVMSPARRTFCLLTTFDLILTFILWVIYTQLIGVTPIWKAFDDQVGNYTFTKSLFDTVMIATSRFTFIILAYALFRIRHWWVIAISTSMTCVYLLVKCFLFEFNDKLLGGRNPLSYVLLIVCFVLAWVETWMLDFKVIPEETQIVKASRAQRRARQHHSDRDPLLQNEYEQSTATIDTREFYTPEGSEDEEEQANNNSLSASSSSHHHRHSHHHGHNHHHHKGKHERKASDSSLGSISSLGSNASMYSVRSLASPESENYRQLLDTAKQDMLEMFYEDDWKLETGKSLEEGMVYCKNIKKYGRKLFKLKGFINMAPRDLWEDMVKTLNESPEWNPTILESRTLVVVDDTTEIMYNIANEAAGGLISARDFVTVRHWLVHKNMHIVASVSCACPEMPIQKKYVRGENGPGGWVFEAVDGEPDKCLFTWIVNSNLKGWLPQAAIDQAMSGVLTTYFTLLLQHYADIIDHRRTQQA
ncbi:steroidogenic acute regulatory protein-like isoform X3 [Mya arenaria]|uniref:steroidogenic acute regulatory protein-like isoform X3 n=1 Tax=Mya arenaria TaxID=6604 RepID=UPI0022E275BC|nr:steroidogenic acute regulatory protein-like isoform X3 [Mya arenaria]